jgi:hypothetical protein
LGQQKQLLADLGATITKKLTPDFAAVAPQIKQSDCGCVHQSVHRNIDVTEQDVWFILGVPIWPT